MKTIDYIGISMVAFWVLLAALVCSHAQGFAWDLASFY